MSDVLLAIRQEATELEQSAVTLQDDLGPFLHISGDAAVAKAQALDLLSQRLRGLADFLGALAPTIPGEWHCDADTAAALLTLSDLRNRLAGSREDAQLAPSIEAGALELFQVGNESTAVRC